MSTASQATIEIAALLGFETHPHGHEQDIDYLLENYTGACFALRSTDLPIGDFADEGMCEAVVLIVVPVDGRKAEAARRNSALASQCTCGRFGC
jgi:hypothetical protein